MGHEKRKEGGLVEWEPCALFFLPPGNTELAVILRLALTFRGLRVLAGLSREQPGLLWG